MPIKMGGFLPKLGANGAGLVDVYVKWTTGATGAVDTTTYGNQVTSVTRASTGTYTITLNTAAYEVWYASASILAASGGGNVQQAIVYIADQAADPLVVTVYTADKITTGSPTEDTLADPPNPSTIMLYLVLRTSQCR